jgi:hypothetical protein
LTATFASGSKLSSIEEYTFQFCSSLASICIPSLVEHVGQFCFTECRSLSSVTFESDSKLLSIGDYAFWDCASLSSICLPASLERVRSLSFRGCAALRTVAFESASKLSRATRDALQLSICIPASPSVSPDSCVGGQRYSNDDGVV